MSNSQGNRGLLRFEHRTHPVASRRMFVARMLLHSLYSTTLVFVVLGVGVVGYRVLAGLGWVDSIYSASMILTGMGPVGALPNDESKMFVSGYALFSSVGFMTAAAFLVSPVLHRLLHVLHMERGDGAS